jgi:putative component of membrane protein insertase Oxa1/YidC/SpoIIIJ protein YidD
MIFTNFHTKAISFAGKTIAFILILLINLIRPMLGPSNICPFTIGCTQYALLQLQEQSLLIALKNITQRLVQCHPFGKRF